MRSRPLKTIDFYCFPKPRPAVPAPVAPKPRAAVQAPVVQNSGRNQSGLSGGIPSSQRVCRNTEQARRDFRRNQANHNGCNRDPSALSHDGRKRSAVA